MNLKALISPWWRVLLWPYTAWKAREEQLDAEYDKLYRESILRYLCLPTQKESQTPDSTQVSFTCLDCNIESKHWFKKPDRDRLICPECLSVQLTKLKGCVLEPYEHVVFYGRFMR